MWKIESLLQLLMGVYTHAHILDAMTQESHSQLYNIEMLPQGPEGTCMRRFISILCGVLGDWKQ